MTRGIRHLLTMGIIYTIIGIMGLSLTSCAEVASTVVEGAIWDGINNAKPSTGPIKSEKARRKQEKQLKKEGKCPTCQGMGKTPDGLNTCLTCNGTGKYMTTNEE